MRIALTGTPGTGKTTVSECLDDAAVVHLTQVIEANDLWSDRDDDRDSLVVDIEGVEAWLDANEPDAEVVVVESHLAHLLDVERVIVLRCHPEELSERLDARGISERKREENAESEALDVILVEAVDRHGPDAVYEIDTTGRAPAAVTDDVRDVITGDRDPSAGTVDFTDYL